MKSYLLAGRMYALTDIELTVKVQCAQCGVQATAARLRYFSGMELEWSTLPDDWTLLNDRAYCPQHVVTIDEKGA